MQDVANISPVKRPISARVRVPGSKSLTNRALAIAAFAAGRSTLRGALHCDDSSAMCDSLRRLGISVEAPAGDGPWFIDGCGGRLAVDNVTLDARGSGTTMRFLAALVATGRGTFVLDGNARMRQRPIGDLVDAMRSIGIPIDYLADRGCPPIRIHASGGPGGDIAIEGQHSSQFTSALLMTGPLTTRDFTVRIDADGVSKSYIEMTLRVMQEFGADFQREGNVLRFQPGGVYRATDYTIEPDASAASYFMAAAAITGGVIEIEGLTQASVQGDIAFATMLERMGCVVEWTKDSVKVTGAQLHGISANLTDCSDLFPTLAVVAAFANSPTSISGIAHVRHKESDRIAAMRQELAKVGVQTSESADGLLVQPTPLSGNVRFDTYDDHRIAMSLSLIGIRIPGISIDDPACVAKTYPNFFSDLRSLAQSAGGDVQIP